MRHRGQAGPTGGRGEVAGCLGASDGGAWAWSPQAPACFPGSGRRAPSLLGTVGLCLQRPCPGPPASHTHLASSLLFFFSNIYYLAQLGLSCGPRDPR